MMQEELKRINFWIFAMMLEKMFPQQWQLQ
jgi:hypothetical protein